MNPTLAAALSALDRAGFVGGVWDAELRSAGLTSEMRRIFAIDPRAGEPPVGEPLFSPAMCAFMERAQGGMTIDSQRAMLRLLAPWSALDPAELRAAVDPRLTDALDDLPAPVPAAECVIDVNFGTRTMRLDMVSLVLRDDRGEVVGGALVSKPAHGGTVLAMLASGDAALFERMLGLVEAARRPSALLFADLEASTALSRRLSSHEYFRLVRRLTARIDAAAVGRGGVVGKHVGDGMTAFFLSQTIGSDSAAARACIECARDARDAMAEVAERSGLAPEQVRLRMGLHWGATPFIGRLLTSGRTEVTAIGDEVNEAARIEPCATGGRILASKALVERLEADDAAAIGVDPDARSYIPLAELPHAPEKARRDAPALSVTEL